MKYGIYFAYWETSWNVDFIPYIKKAHDLGFDILEISCAGLLDKTLSQLAELRVAADHYGITLTAGYGPSASQNLAVSDAGEAINFYSQLLYRLSLLNIHTIGGGIYSYWPVDYSVPVQKERDWEYAVEHVRTVGRTAADYGIDYCLEVLNRFEGYLLNTADEAIRFTEQVGLPSVRVMLDTFHMNIEETSMTDAIRRTGSLLGHFHVGENNRRLPGFGKLPWLEIGNALKSINYQGAVVMEPFVTGAGEIAHDVRLWRTLASPEELDKDASLSLSYLKNIFS